ncbi:hypothetical protein GCM10023094_22740 [Rhodococcus olei]|uniref:DUF3263 domain-containing protein n=1 Tax=Rhodococcus olei TaxID=2161675 RepID=A0ABP8P2F1_9NOCA
MTYSFEGPDGPDHPGPSGPRQLPSPTTEPVTGDRPGRRREDNELLAFAARWAPFGGPPDEEVFLEFGMTPERFRMRVRDAATRLACISPTDPRLRHFRSAMREAATKPPAGQDR